MRFTLPWFALGFGVLVISLLAETKHRSAPPAIPKR
jgi:hypothetical protein